MIPGLGNFLQELGIGGSAKESLLSSPLGNPLKAVGNVAGSNEPGQAMHDEFFNAGPIPLAGLMSAGPKLLQGITKRTNPIDNVGSAAVSAGWLPESTPLPSDVFSPNLPFKVARFGADVTRNTAAFAEGIGNAGVRTSQYLRENSGKPEEVAMDGAKMFADALEGPTLGLSKLGGVAVDLVKEGRRWSEMLADSSRGLAAYNAEISASVELADAAKINRDIEFAEQTSGTASAQIDSENRMQENLQPGKVLMRSLEQAVSAKVNDLQSAIIEGTGVNQAILAVQEKIFGQGEKSEGMPVLDMHSRLAANYRDQQRDNHRKRLEP